MSTPHKRNIYWLIAGLIALATALIHTFGGQSSLVEPLMESTLSAQVRGELWGVWHMITGFLFLGAGVTLRHAFKGRNLKNAGLMQFLGSMYCLMAVPSALNSLLTGLLIPQWILLLPIGLLILWGNRS